MANNLTKSGLTLGSKTADYTAEFNSEDFELMNLPLWSEVSTFTTGDAVVPDCIVDVDSFVYKYSYGVIIGQPPIPFDITSFKTGLLYSCNRVTNMSGMFYYCTRLTSADVSSFDTSNVTSMSRMFHSCSNLKSLNLSNFDTSKVTDMYRMFHSCSNLKSLNLSNFDTSKVTDMSGMFGGCSSLTHLNISNFDTGKVTDMSMMFYSCSSLTSLNLSSFDTSNVINMDNMFGNCTSLTSLTLSSNWGHELINWSTEGYRTLDLSTTAITKAVANDVLSKLANVSGGKYKPIVIFKSSLGLSSTEIKVGTNKGWDVQAV